MLRPVRARVANMIARGVVKLVDDSQKLQLLQLSVGPDEVRDQVERFQQYGLTSLPDAGAEAVVVFVGGARDHGLAVAVDDRRYRVSGLASGEVVIYSKAGQTIWLKADGTIEIGGGTMQPAALGQDVRDELDALWSALQGHTHAVTNVSTVISAAPGSPCTGALSVPAPSVTAQKKTVKSASVKIKT